MNRFEKSTWLRSIPIGGMIMSCTREETIFPNAAPMMKPTARSITLPRMANSLNSLNMGDSFGVARRIRFVAGLYRRKAANPEENNPEKRARRRNKPQSYADPGQRDRI